MIKHYQSIAVNDPGQLAGKLNEWRFKEVKVLSAIPSMGTLNNPCILYLIEITFNTQEEKETILKELNVKRPKLVK
jgi:hypothetical protein